jgi:hypothetical protein
MLWIILSQNKGKSIASTLILAHGSLYNSSYWSSTELSFDKAFENSGL